MEEGSSIVKQQSLERKYANNKKEFRYKSPESVIPSLTMQRIG